MRSNTHVTLSLSLSSFHLTQGMSFMRSNTQKFTSKISSQNPNLFIMENERNIGTTSSSKWKPTKEQIMLLENLYKQGIRTPSTNEIHQITGRLRAHGHVEGKNIFYWFQNYKARQRQKQKHECITYFNRFFHKTSRFFRPTPFSNIGCVSPYYLQQASNHQNQHGYGSIYIQDFFHSNNPISSSGGYDRHTITDNKKQLSDITTTSAGMSISSNSLRFDRFDLRDHGYYGEGTDVNSNGRKTLSLFPLQPSDAVNDDGAGNFSFGPSHDSPVTYFSDGDGREQPFYDFFSSCSSRFDDSANGL